MEARAVRSVRRVMSKCNGSDRVRQRPLKVHVLRLWHAQSVEGRGRRFVLLPGPADHLAHQPMRAHRPGCRKRRTRPMRLAAVRQCDQSMDAVRRHLPEALAAAWHVAAFQMRDQVSGEHRDGVSVARAFAGGRSDRRTHGRWPGGRRGDHAGAARNLGLRRYLARHSRLRVARRVALFRQDSHLGGAHRHRGWAVSPLLLPIHHHRAGRRNRRSSARE